MAKKKAANTALAQHADQQNSTTSHPKQHKEQKLSKQAAAEVPEDKPASAGKKRAKDEIDAIFGSKKKQEAAADDGAAGDEQQMAKDLQDIAQQVAQEKVGAVAAVIAAIAHGQGHAADLAIDVAAINNNHHHREVSDHRAWKMRVRMPQSCAARNSGTLMPKTAVASYEHIHVLQPRAGRMLHGYDHVNSRQETKTTDAGWIQQKCMASVKRACCLYAFPPIAAVDAAEACLHCPNLLECT